MRKSFTSKNKKKGKKKTNVVTSASSLPLPPWEPGRAHRQLVALLVSEGRSCGAPRTETPALSRLCILACRGSSRHRSATSLFAAKDPRLLLRSSAPADHRQKKNPEKRRERKQKRKQEKEKTSRWMKMELWKEIAMLMWEPPRETVCVFCGLSGRRP